MGSQKVVVTRSGQRQGQLLSQQEEQAVVTEGLGRKDSGSWPGPIGVAAHRVQRPCSLDKAVREVAELKQGKLAL